MSAYHSGNWPISLAPSTYSFISQLETGRGRIPPDRYKAWANALRMPVNSFVRETMRFYDPITYEILFDGQHE